MDSFEQNVERIYQTWESLFQEIRNNSDIERFQRIIDQNKWNFNTERYSKMRCLNKYIHQIDAELKENTICLKNLQNQRFASNMTKKQAIIRQTHKIQFIERTIQL